MTHSLLALICALYGPRHPDNYGFDILIGAEPNLDSDGVVKTIKSEQTQFVIRAVVYTASSYGDWKIVKTGSNGWYTRHKALKEFVKGLRDDFGNRD